MVERIIAPLEENPATIAYETGRQIIYNDWLYEVIDDIAVGDALVAYEDDPTNANIKLASPVETQVLALNNKTYKYDDSTETTIDDADYIPFYDSSASAMKKIAVSNAKFGSGDIVSNSGDAYSASKAYSVGDLVIYNDTLYRCITACSAAAWSVNSSCFTADTLVNATSQLNSDLTKLFTRNKTVTLPFTSDVVGIIYVEGTGTYNSSNNTQSLTITVNGSTKSRQGFKNALNDANGYILLNVSNVIKKGDVVNTTSTNVSNIAARVCY